jgi:hypothetical protein
MHGRDALVRYLLDWNEMFEGFTVELLEVEPMGTIRSLSWAGSPAGRA